MSRRHPHGRGKRPRVQDRSRVDQRPAPTRPLPDLTARPHFPARRPCNVAPGSSSALRSSQGADVRCAAIGQRASLVPESPACALRFPGKAWRRTARANAAGTLRTHSARQPAPSFACAAWSARSAAARAARRRKRVRSDSIQCSSSGDSPATKRPSRKSPRYKSNASAWRPATQAC